MVKTLSKGGFDANLSYLICAANGDCAVVDPCGECAHKLETLNIPQENMKYILITHGHSDHFDALEKVKKLFPSAMIAGYRNAEFHKDIPLEDSSCIEFGSSFIEVFHTPGHSRDSLCYMYAPDNALFTGDTLFIDCIGFCRSPKIMSQSLIRLRAMPDELIIYSGHDYGTVPYRTIKEEKIRNPEFSEEFIQNLSKERH